MTFFIDERIPVHSIDPDILQRFGLGVERGRDVSPGPTADWQPWFAPEPKAMPQPQSQTNWEAVCRYPGIIYQPGMRMPVEEQPAAKQRCFQPMAPVPVGPRSPVETSLKTQGVFKEEPPVSAEEMKLVPAMPAKLKAVGY